MTTTSDVNVPTLEERAGLGVWCTVLCHPDMSRVGGRALIGARGAVNAVLSRTEPSFDTSPGGLDTPRVSRRPVTLTVRGDVLTVAVDADRADVLVDGVPAAPTLTLAAAALDPGVVIQLGHSVALLLHLGKLVRRPQRSLGLPGGSDAIARLRDEVTRVADLDVPVLLRGGTGAGKELVARAIHACGPRAAGPFVTLNVAALTESVAVSELFGHVRGALSGATADHAGAFERANGGVLFLDGVGDTPAAVQPMLLRVLETGEVLPAGARVARRVDVRVLSATEADLEASAEGRLLRYPLLQRLAGVTLQVPSLAQRPDDIARLFYGFLQEELARSGQTAWAEDRPGVAPLVSAAVVAQLVRAPWPGNVRQLRNIVRQVVLEADDSGRIDPESVGRLLVLKARPEPVGGPRRAEPPPAEPVAPPPRAESRRQGPAPAAITDEELVAVLRAHGWRRGEAAKALGMARSTLYLRIDACPLLRKATSISRDELEGTLQTVGGDLARASEQLQVSVRGLRLRAGELGLDLPRVEDEA